MNRNISNILIGVISLLLCPIGIFAQVMPMELHPDRFIISNNGLGNIKLGTPFKNLPPVVNGLYQECLTNGETYNLRVDTIFDKVKKDRVDIYRSNTKVYSASAAISRTLIDSYDEDIYHVRTVGEIDTLLVIKIIDKEKKLFEKKRILRCVQNRRGDIDTIYVYDYNLRTKEGLNCNSTLYDLYMKGATLHRSITSDEGSSVYFVSVDGVNFFFDETSIDRGRIKPDAKPFCATNSEYPYYG